MVYTWKIRTGEEWGTPQGFESRAQGVSKGGPVYKTHNPFHPGFRPLATKNIFQMDMTQFKTLVLTGEIPVDLALEKGYVILTLKDDVILGLGFYIRGAIRSQLPGKEIRESMLESFCTGE